MLYAMQWRDKYNKRWRWVCASWGSEKRLFTSKAEAREEARVWRGVGAEVRVVPLVPASPEEA